MNLKSNSRMKKKILRQTNKKLKKDVVKRVAWWLKKMKVEEGKKKEEKEMPSKWLMRGVHKKKLLRGGHNSESSFLDIWTPTVNFKYVTNFIGNVELATWRNLERSIGWGSNIWHSHFPQYLVHLLTYFSLESWHLYDSCSNSNRLTLLYVLALYCTLVSDFWNKASSLFQFSKLHCSHAPLFAKRKWEQVITKLF